MIDLHLMASVLASLAAGLFKTVWISLLGALLALGGGILIATGIERGPQWLQRMLSAWTLVTLSLPLLVLLYLLFFALPEYGITLSPTTVGVAGLGLYYAPYVSQLLLGALSAIPPGQFEACRAIGIAPWRYMPRLVVPQMLPLLLPSMTGLMIGLIKDSALLSIISVHEFMHAAKAAISQTYAPLEIYLIVALAYWLVTNLLDILMRRLERRMTRHST